MKKLENEFTEFCQDQSSAPEHIWTQIENAITNRFSVVLALKVFSLYLLASTVVLALCPQFGLSLPFTSINLMTWIMNVAPALCDPYCGGLFLGASFLLLRISLTPQEWSLILRYKPAVFASMTIMSLAVFYIMSAQMAFINVLLWLIGGLLTTQAVSLYRLPLKKSGLET